MKIIEGKPNTSWHFKSSSWFHNAIITLQPCISLRSDATPSSLNNVCRVKAEHRSHLSWLIFSYRPLTEDSCSTQCPRRTFLLSLVSELLNGGFAVIGLTTTSNMSDKTAQVVSIVYRAPALYLLSFSFCWVDLAEFGVTSSFARNCLLANDTLEETPQEHTGRHVFVRLVRHGGQGCMLPCFDRERGLGICCSLYKKIRDWDRARCIFVLLHLRITRLPRHDA